MKPDINSLIIYEDPYIIVCHKPSGVPTQSAKIGTPDMASLLKTHLASRNPYLAVIQPSAHHLRIWEILPRRRHRRP